MNSTVIPCTLSKALLALLPGATLASRRQRAWHSATFSGDQVVFVVKAAGEDCAARARAFAQALPEIEFALQGQLVADILVSNISACEGGIALTVEALLLDE